MEDIGGTVQGQIFNIQGFCIHDGPGIRTTVFVKGCPLRCKWCSNPESQDRRPNLLTRDVKCTLCGKCIPACPQNAISIVGDKRLIDWSRCDNCLKCVEACIYGSLNICGKTVTAQEVFDECKKDAIFYKTSGGGVTVSGGEPLMQPDFLINILKFCKKEGLHTALDTSGYGDWDSFKKALAYTDLLLFDIKHLDPQMHKKYTGVSNEIILSNLKNINSLVNNTAIWLRVALIPTVNDGESHILEIARLGKFVGAHKISLLPYHEGGKSKCDQIGIVYELPELQPPSDTEVRHLQQLISQEGIECTVGY